MGRAFLVDADTDVSSLHPSPPPRPRTPVPWPHRSPRGRCRDETEGPVDQRAATKPVESPGVPSDVPPKPPGSLPDEGPSRYHRAFDRRHLWVDEIRARTREGARCRPVDRAEGA